MDYDRKQSKHLDLSRGDRKESCAICILSWKNRIEICILTAFDNAKVTKKCASQLGPDM